MKGEIINMENMELVIFEIIANGGNAKALVFDAVKAAEEGKFEEADALMKEADEFLTLAHNTQTKILQEEASGQKTEVSVLFVHAQDHLMTAIESRSWAERYILLNKRLWNLEHK